MWAGVCILLFFSLVEAKIQLSVQECDFRPPCPCRNSPLNQRVVGGHQAGYGVFPYAVTLHMAPYNGIKDNSPVCGGTLISDSYVLTAAHCTKYRKAQDFMVAIGIYKAEERSTSHLKKVISIKRYPDYLPTVSHYDIALLELESPVHWEHGLRAAVLPPHGLRLEVGVRVTVYGWGRTNYKSGVKPETLQAVSLPIVDNESCQKTPFKTSIMSNMLCAGGEAGKDACIGDSGSGLVARLGNEYVLYGIVSFGRGCAKPHVPGVYTKVSNYTEWIMSETRSSGCRPCIYGDDASNKSCDPELVLSRGKD